jgi:DNA polymerase-3 subunit delta'
MEIAPAENDNKSGQIKVEQIRQLQPFMMHKPARGGWRVALIDSMDEVNRNSANAMLKLLEEPPKKVAIFLIASRLGQVPPTIRSRCRIVRLAPLSQDNCQMVLSKLCPNTDTKDIEMIAVLSQGAPGQAVRLKETGAADMYQTVCALLTEQEMDTAALMAICRKWGGGSATNGREVREGAALCIGRLLRLAALYATGIATLPYCSFEKAVIDTLIKKHSAEQLACLHDNFISEGARAEGLYIDFGRFLERHLTKLFQKTLL